MSNHHELALELAKLSDVQDVHMTRWHNGKLEARFRSYGKLIDAPWSRDFSEYIWSECMWHGALLQLDLSKPQHSVMRFTDFAVRLAYAPMLHGRRLVLRLHMRKVVDVKDPCPDCSISGLSILYGLTGSGKTTTAYCWLDQLSKQYVVIGIEDPPECLSMRWPQFDRSLSDDYGLHKLVLRQNPDVLFWGEMRDESAWAMVFNWVTTGHHVVTTMHAKSLEQCHDRLRGFGASDSFLTRYVAGFYPSHIVLK